MRIAFDLDGVLADLHTAFTDAALQIFPNLDRRAIAAPDVGASPPAEDAPVEAPALPEGGALALSRRQADEIWAALAGRENFWESLQEIEPGAIARLAATAEARRWDVLFITSRPQSAGDTVQRQSQRWLQRMGFPLPSAYVVHGSRGRVAQALDLDVVVDDRPDNCLDVVLESRAGAVLVWRGDEAAVPSSARRLGIAVSRSVTDCIATIVEAESTSPGGSFLERLRRLFGLRTRPAASLRRP